ncbi:polysaccharide lyase family 7 protein [Reichenbachiella carrageenanivorans]|uniref:Polysaccharide lyase family 7 protein n=1 Tax=Reichenbachiella carrageenanivorans TaxID=2979869 RepID=A0ABY6CY27_9BACT|nr:polysaccharide lyase family 7 protein [Reichenbachiella carrageenanivorans]UXX78270.1 polysaccharide lyase family 7 protein [Reichenbachiella carrageenanivorans]
MKERKSWKNWIMFMMVMGVVFSFQSCGEDSVEDTIEEVEKEETDNEKEEEEKKETDDGRVEGVDYFLPNIDLSHWKVTLPIGNPTEVEPPAIKDYATNETVLPFMYNDSTDGSLVFYSYPDATTTNTKYSRTELREQMVPGSNNTNWTFPDGAYMKGTLAIDDITKDASGDYHRVIIMQIHGRLTNEQRNLIGQSDNNAPPILKIYWEDGEVRVKSKELKDPSATDTEILKTDAWDDDDGVNFKEHVDFDKFTLEVKVSDGKMEITLNDDETLTYDGDDFDRWNIFENYFKAGNYFQSEDEGSYAKVKYYELTISHD